jgi:hypothetical protein
MVSWQSVIDNRKPRPRFGPGPYFRAYAAFGSKSDCLANTGTSASASCGHATEYVLRRYVPKLP